MRTDRRPDRQRWPIYRLFAAGLLAVVLLSAAAIVLLPIGWQLNRLILWLHHYAVTSFGIRWISVAGYDFLLNMALFAIPAGLAAIAWPRLPVGALLLGCLAASLAIEVTQHLILPRDASWLDVASNTAGGTLGTLAGRFLVPVEDRQ